MGSSSSSRTESSNKTENFNFNNVDNGVGDGTGGGNNSFNLANSTTGNISLEQTDLGAINKAFEFADSTLELATQSSAPSANTINTIGKNVAIIVAIGSVAYLAKAKLS